MKLLVLVVLLHFSEIVTSSEIFNCKFISIKTERLLYCESTMKLYRPYEISGNQIDCSRPEFETLNQFYYNLFQELSVELPRRISEKKVYHRKIGR